MTKFVQSLTNGTTTTNGDKAYKSTLDAVLDLFSRGASSTDKLNLVVKAIEDDKLLATKCALYLRDIREGMGNRDIYQNLVAAGKKFPTIIFWNVNANYGNSTVTKHETGAVLVDGYSPNVLKSLFSGELETYTPIKAMLEVLTPKYGWLD